ncbi:hypothetical protein Trydic_g23341 [Trypoxylus dichotomus]
MLCKCVLGTLCRMIRQIYSLGFPGLCQRKLEDTRLYGLPLLPLPLPYYAILLHSNTLRTRAKREKDETPVHSEDDDEGASSCLHRRNEILVCLTPELWGIASSHTSHNATSRCTFLITTSSLADCGRVGERPSTNDHILSVEKPQSRICEAETTP